MIRDAVAFDKGWLVRENEDEEERKRTLRRAGKLQKRQKKVTAPRTIRNVKRGFDLAFHDTEAITQWPWSLHWSLEDVTFKNKLYKSTIDGVQEWIASQERRGYGTGQAERERRLA